MLTNLLSASMRFCEASAAFLQARDSPVAKGGLRHIGKNTHKDYAKKARRLGIFFDQLPLSQIHLGHLIQYQKDRASGEGFTRLLGKEVVQSPAGAEKINSEIRLLIRIMKMAAAAAPKRTAWQEIHEAPDAEMMRFAQNLLQIETFYLPYQVIENDIPRALTQDQQDHFLRTASSNPEWHRVWWYSIAARHLTFSSDEMRTIRIGDINLSFQIVGVNRRFGKNKYRRREIPIVDGACMWALEQQIKWCKDHGGGEPHHYLYPGRLVRNVFDHETHMSETGLRKPFEACRARADLDWFQLNGWRHTAITNLAEAGVPIATIMERAGHMTPKMSAHYTHISQQAHRQAMVAASKRKPVVSIQDAQLRQRLSAY